MKKLTVVIPAYKASDTLYFTIYSLMMQTNKDFKCIIVQDGADAEQEKVIQKIVADSNLTFPLRVIDSYNNCGVGEARQRGLAVVDTDYVTFLDADDYLLPYAVDMFIKHMKDTPEVIIGKTLREDENGSLFPVGREQITWVHGRAYNVRFLRSNGIKFPSLRMSEDLAFNALCFEFAEKIVTIDIPIHMQRCVKGSLSHCNESEYNQAKTYIKAMYSYLTIALSQKDAKDLRLLPQFLAMAYFYIDAVYYYELFDTYDEATALYREMASDFYFALEMLNFPSLSCDFEWIDKLDSALVTPIRPYNGKRFPPVKSFIDRVQEIYDLMEKRNGN